MSFGTTTQTINADRVKILRLAVEVTLASNVTVRKSRTVDRLNTRAGPIDTYRWKLEEIEFTAALTELLKTQIQTDSELDANSALAFNNWKINGISTSGSGADNTDDTLSANVIDFEDLAPENGLALTRVKLRVAPVAS